MGVHPGRYTVLCVPVDITQMRYMVAAVTHVNVTQSFSLLMEVFVKLKKIKSLLSYHTSYIERSQVKNKIPHGQFYFPILHVSFLIQTLTVISPTYPMSVPKEVKIKCVNYCSLTTLRINRANMLPT